MTEQFANFAQSSLAAPITAYQKTLSVADPSSFPKLGNFRIVVQSFDVTTQIPTSAPELMLATAVAGNVFTVTRGIEGTMPRAFASGAQVACILTAGVMQALTTGETPTGRIVDASQLGYAVQMANNDGIVEINNSVGGATAVTTPANPVPFQIYTLVDGTEDAQTNNITLTAHSGTGTFNGGNSSVLMNANGASYDFYWNNTNWRLK